METIQEDSSISTLAEFTKQYLITALWSSNDDSNDQGGEPLDQHHDLESFAPDAMRQAILDCKLFLAKAGNLIEGYKLDGIAHDFWLTRNRHGAGFWDGDYQEATGMALTDLAHWFKECTPYIGDDGLIYFYMG